MPAAPTPPDEAAVLLTGATGFVGGALLPKLREAGALRCLVRDADRLPEADRACATVADLCDADTLAPALEGVEQVYYLVHSMEPGAGDDGFAERDRRAAENYAQAARAAGVRRTIYLGGVGAEDDNSEHLASRREVEEVLGGAGPDLVALRASMIVGSGSASFGTLVRVVDRMPVLALPAWRDRRTQPIGIDDVVACLVRARDVEPGVFEIGGPDTLTFEEMIETIAELLGKQRPSFNLPFSSAGAEAAAAAAVTGEDRELLGPLMAGLDGDLLVHDNAVRDVFGVDPQPFAAAARAAISGMPDVQPEPVAD